MGDDQEEQIKKKKRLILLLLLALLGVTAGAAALIEPAPATTVAALEASPPPPTTKAFTATPQLQGDEWLQPTLPSSGTPATDASPTAAATAAVASENENEASRPDSTPTVENQQKSEADLTSTQPDPPPSSTNAETKEATDEPEINPVTPITSEGGTAVAGDSPSPDESDENTTVTPIEESETVINSGKATLIPTEISRRINESWDFLDGRYMSTAEAEDASLTLAVTTTLTKPSTLSETMVVIPPDGLPVTGVIARRGMNWGAVVVVALLLGAGVAALLYPRSGHR